MRKTPEMMEGTHRRNNADQWRDELDEIFDEVEKSEPKAEFDPNEPPHQD